ncbi:MAG TPA: WcaF family extracellular polysaccharide biosynthesis acetyltransferase [Acidisarcina sp.]
MESPTQPRVDLSTYRDDRSWRYFARRMLWACVQLPFFPKMPKYLSPLRIALLRLFGAKIGRGCMFAGGSRVWVPWNLRMGDYAVVGEGVRVYNLAYISIGDSAVVSQFSYLCSATHDYTDPAFRLVFKPITVQGSAWIAAGVFVSPGVTVGEGAVVGACSVVTKDVPAWTICAGNPCRPIKPRILRSSSVHGGQTLPAE